MNGVTFQLTGIRPSTEWMPSIEAYMAVANALHEASDMCNGNYVLPLDECGAREADISDAISILTELRKDGWSLVRDLDSPGLGL